MIIKENNYYKYQEEYKHSFVLDNKNIQPL